MVKPIRAFTGSYNGISHVLASKATVGLGFDLTRTPVPTQYEFDAIWDTGATNSVISKNVVKQCGLKPTGIAVVNTAGGPVKCNTYLVSIGLPNGVGFPAVRVTEAPIGSADMLIGMDLIAKGDFVVTSFQGKTVFSYRTPSVATIDFVVEAKQMKAPNSTGKTGRNDPCPCGSGKKYKKCCGAN